MKPWVSYSLIRVALFAVTLTLLMLLGVPGWLAAIAAALVGFSVAYIFFRPQRDRLIESVRTAPSTDEDVEDDR